MSRYIEPLVGRVQVINMKLDKCGGLTKGLAMARTARGLGFECMVANMMGTSLAIYFGVKSMRLVLPEKDVAEPVNQFRHPHRASARASAD